MLERWSSGRAPREIMRMRKQVEIMSLDIDLRWFSLGMVGI
jgi:hypothetical protein